MDADPVTFGVGGAISGAMLLQFGRMCLDAWRSRNGRTSARIEPPIPPVDVRPPQPLEVAPAPRFVTCEACELKHKEVDNRLAAGTRAFDAVRSKIDAVETMLNTNQRDVMQSFQKLNDRISPIAETCAENGAAIRILLGENLKPRTKT